MEAVRIPFAGGSSGFGSRSGFDRKSSHWLVGRWVEALGPKAEVPSGYFGIYTGIALLLLLSSVGLPSLHAIRRREHLDIPDEESAAALQASPPSPK
jgi:hypothetical protein